MKKKRTFSIEDNTMDQVQELQKVLTYPHSKSQASIFEYAIDTLYNDLILSK